MVIFEKKTISNRNEIGKIRISSQNLPTMDIKNEKMLMRMFYGKLKTLVSKFKITQCQGQCKCTGTICDVGCSAWGTYGSTCSLNSEVYIGKNQITI